MEVILAAILGEVATRSFSFLIDKYMAGESRRESVDEMLQRLQLLLLRVRVILEEADRRSITIQAMLQQLNILRKEMYRGYYVLDSFRGNQTSQGEAEGRNNVRPPFTLSKFSHAKRLFLSATSVAAGASGTCTQCMSVKEVQQVSKNLGTIIFHMSEFLTFLKYYPPRYRQPYSIHLMIGLSMFGRQMEMERVINFLMQTEPSMGESTGVLPITGPAGVGKSTLVAHVYNSEKVREHFSRIVLVTHEDLKNRRLATLKDGGLTIHQSNLSPNGNVRLLVIIELLEDVEEDIWKRWYVDSAACLESGSKIVITSRSSKIQKFGTTQALLLNVLPIEAYWYFFKVLTFGSANPENQPKMQSVALEIAWKMNGSFAAAYITSSFLRTNFTAGYWLRVLAYINKYTNNYPNSYVMEEQKPQYYRRTVPDKTTYFVFYGVYQTNFQHGHVDPKIKLQDVLSGRVQCLRRCEVLAWKSQIPPYGSYIFSCAISKSSEIKKQNHRANIDQVNKKKVMVC